MENKDIINLLYERLNEQGLWFTTDVDYTFGKKDIYKLNEYGKLADEKEEDKVAKEIKSFIGDGAINEKEAIGLWLDKAMYTDCSINYTDNLHMDFEEEPIIDNIDAYEVDINKKAGPGVAKSVDVTTGPDILSEAKLKKCEGHTVDEDGHIYYDEGTTFECMDCAYSFEFDSNIDTDPWGNPFCPRCGSGDVAPYDDIEECNKISESVKQDLLDANIEDLTTEGGEDWIVFYLGDKELASYPFSSTFEGELPDTREQLAKENNVSIKDIKVKAITKNTSEQKLQEGINDPVIDSYTTGKWKVELKAQPGKKPVAYFYDMSQDKARFPEGQYTYSYYVDTLLGKDGYGTPMDQMTAFRLDNDVPAWTIEGEDLKNIANWLKEFDSKYNKDVKTELKQTNNTRKGRRNTKELNYRLDGFNGVYIAVVDRKNNIDTEQYMDFDSMEFGIDEYEFEDDMVDGIKEILTNIYEYTDDYYDDRFTDEKIREIAEDITQDVLQLYDDLPEENIDREKGIANLNVTEGTLMESEEVHNSEFTLVTANEDKIKELENGSAFTWEGMDTSEDNLQSIADFFKENTPNIKLPINFYTWTGDVFNEMYGLTGSNAYPKDLNFLSIALDNWSSLGSLPMIKFQVGARWLDDIVSNNARRQENFTENKKLSESLCNGKFSGKLMEAEEDINDEDITDEDADEITDLDVDEKVDVETTPQDTLNKRTQDLYNLLCDNDLKVEVSVDNGENEVSVILNQQGGKIIIPVRDNNELTPVTGGSISLDEDSLKILDQVKQILSEEEI